MSNDDDFALRFYPQCGRFADGYGPVARRRTGGDLG